MRKRTTRFWPIPGTMEHYLENIAKILSRISRNSNYGELVNWASKEFGTGGEWTGDAIMAVVISPGLANKEGATIALTEVGLKFLNTKDPGVILQAFLDRIWGVSEILLWLRENPMSLRQILQRCVEFGASWTQPAQVDFRLRWLTSLGCVERSGTIYSLTDRGKEVSNDLTQKGIAPEVAPTHRLSRVEVHARRARTLEDFADHSDIQSALLRLGELEGYEVKKEYPVNKERLDAIWMRRAREKPDFAFEIQVGGSVHSALVKLKEAWDKWRCLAVLVVTEENREEAERWLSRAFHEMERDARVAPWREIKEWYDASERRRRVKEKLKIE